MPAAVWGRFDDTLAGSALLFEQVSDVVVAWRPEDVVPALDAVHRATAGGAWAFGFVAYEAAPGLDPALQGVGEPAEPLVWFGLGPAPVTVANVIPAPGDTGTWAAGWTTESYRQQVQAVRAHIAAGDTYQVNLTARLRGRLRGDTAALYAHLQVGQRTPYAALLETGQHAVVSASPELFFEWSGERVMTRPMKGTAARGRFPSEDEQQAARLCSSAKERAENLMIVDLLRNDLARACVLGSVRVPEMLRLERYGTVWQLTSDVEARVDGATTLSDLFRALFPCGSVTGAPKQRTMALIAALEQEPRGVYCGAIGYVAPPGGAVRARFSVGIRTAVVDLATRGVVYGTGSAITWDSEPFAEETEMWAKSAILASRPKEHRLLETMRFEPGEGLCDLDRHLGRLAWSAEMLGFVLDVQQVGRALAAVDEPAARRVRLLLERSGVVEVQVCETPPSDVGPVRLQLCPDPVDAWDRWLFHKTTMREGYTSRAARHPGADDIVLVNQQGEVTETTIANLAVRLGDRWWTPPLGSGCLPGVRRQRLVEQGILAERVLTVADVRAAQELAVVSSLRGWREAVLEEAVLAEGG